MKHINFQISKYICINIQSMQFPFIWYGAINLNIYRENTNIEKNLYMRTSEASELIKFLLFRILILLFPSIFCWYFSYFADVA